MPLFKKTESGSYYLFEGAEETLFTTIAYDLGDERPLLLDENGIRPMTCHIAALFVLASRAVFRCSNNLGLLTIFFGDVFSLPAL